MANQEQLKILKQSIKAWNEWKYKNPGVKIDLSGAKLSGAKLSDANFYRANFYRADLSGADLSGAKLSVAKLSGADLSGADLSDAILICAYLSDAILSSAYLSDAILSSANLSSADLSSAKLIRADLSSANLSSANLSSAKLIRANLSSADLSSAKLIRANLSSADLSSANLSSAYLSSADLQGAKLIRANLSRITALGTNFKGAIFTEACVQDWNINNETNFENVTCEYIYLKKDKKERRPASGNFASGDFAKLVEKSIETVDLIFSEGIDWKAFLGSFNDLRVEYADQNVSIQAIEQKSDGAFVIRLSVPPDANKAEIENYVKQSYETKLKVLEAQYREKLQAKDTEINIYKQQSANMLEIVRLQASRPITVEAKTVVEKDNILNQFNAPVGSVGNQGKQTNTAGVVKGDQIETQNNYASQETLTAVATKIESLLDYFENNDPSITQAQQIVKTATDNQPELMNAEIIQESINSSCTLRQRIEAAGKTGSIETVKLFFPPFAIAYEAYKAFRNP